MTRPKTIYVQPGELRWSLEPCTFKTLLGSCVAVCLWDAVQGSGGMTHFVLPRGRGCNDDAKYGDVAVPRLAAQLRSLGCSTLVAKVFGGATIFSVTGTSSIGASNTAAAIELLQAERISVLSQRTGGTQGIVLYFTTSNGAAYLRRITGYDSTGMQV